METLILNNNGVTVATLKPQKFYALKGKTKMEIFENKIYKQNLEMIFKGKNKKSLIEMQNYLINGKNDNACHSNSLNFAKTLYLELYCGYVVGKQNGKYIIMSHCWNVLHGKVLDFTYGNKNIRNYVYIGIKLNPQNFANYYDVYDLLEKLDILLNEEYIKFGNTKYYLKYMIEIFEKRLNEPLSN